MSSISPMKVIQTVGSQETSLYESIGQSAVNEGKTETVYQSVERNEANESEYGDNNSPIRFNKSGTIINIHSSLENNEPESDRLKSNTLRINFDTVKKDKQKRIYTVEDDLRQELEKKLRFILSQRDLYEMNQIVYRCVSCNCQFSQEGKKSNKFPEIRCPDCKSTFVAEVHELSKSLDKPKYTERVSPAADIVKDSVVGDEQLKMFCLLNGCYVTSNNAKRSFQLSGPFATDSRLYLTSNKLMWLCADNERDTDIELCVTQLMSNLVEIERPAENIALINFLDETQNKCELWRRYFETKDIADSFLKAIAQSWEKLFGVPLFNT
uniref:Uncharacterized protein n=1 Tax=Glossina pallidipes TaxID=7398 RepID=A0A1B0AAH6_GLOPL